MSLITFWSQDLIVTVLTELGRAGLLVWAYHLFEVPLSIVFAPSCLGTRGSDGDYRILCCFTDCIVNEQHTTLALWRFERSCGQTGGVVRLYHHLPFQRKSYVGGACGPPKWQATRGEYVPRRGGCCIYGVVVKE